MRVSLYDDLDSRKMKGKVQSKKLAAPLRPNVAKPLIMMMMMMIMMIVIMVMMMKMVVDMMMKIVMVMVMILSRKDE